MTWHHRPDLGMAKPDNAGPRRYQAAAQFGVSAIPAGAYQGWLKSIRKSKSRQSRSVEPLPFDFSIYS